MKFFRGGSDENRADLASDRQNSDTNPVSNSLLSLLREHYRHPNLDKLASRISSGVEELLLRHPLEINSLEMLEAELANQGITSLRPQKTTVVSEESSLWTRAQSCTSLAQRATLESTVWRWRARRLGMNAKKLRFRVDIRLFLLSWAAELEEALENSHSTDNRVVFIRKPQLSSNGTDDLHQVRQKLIYLDEIAAFLNGDVRRRAHPFDRGLDVILKVLSVPGKSSSPGHSSIEPVYTQDGPEDASSELVLTLPLSRGGFFQAVRAFTSNDPAAE